MLAEGASYSSIKLRLGTTAPTISRWKQRFLAAGLDGLDQRTDPGRPASDEDLGLLNEAELQARTIGYLPRTLPEALAAFEGDAVLTAPLSPVIASEFLKIKRLELQAYNLHVHPWERRLYLEAI